MATCALCGKAILDYYPGFNRLDLEEGSVDLCQDCIGRFLEWQQRNLARLFPTRAAKRRFGREK